jgi:hypothetical protein
VCVCVCVCVCVRVTWFSVADLLSSTEGRLSLDQQNKRNAETDSLSQEGAEESQDEDASEEEDEEEDEDNSEDEEDDEEEDEEDSDVEEDDEEDSDVEEDDEEDSDGEEDDGTERCVCCASFLLRRISSHFWLPSIWVPGPYRKFEKSFGTAMRKKTVEIALKPGKSIPKLDVLQRKLGATAISPKRSIKDKSQPQPPQEDAEDDDSDDRFYVRSPAAAVTGGSARKAAHKSDTVKAMYVNALCGTFSLGCSFLRPACHEQTQDSSCRPAEDSVWRCCASAQRRIGTRSRRRPARVAQTHPCYQCATRTQEACVTVRDDA